MALWKQFVIAITAFGVGVAVAVLYVELMASRVAGHPVQYGRTVTEIIVALLFLVAAFLIANRADSK